MKDRILEAFLRRQQEDGAALARQSDLVKIYPVAGDPPERYLARFNCRGLVKGADGGVAVAERFEIGITFPSNYLRSVNPAQILTWLGPCEVFHPNIAHGLPFICAGRLGPGTSLVDLVHQCFEIITYKRVTMREDDSLNPEACQWARHHRHLFPIDARPLKRRAIQIAATIADRSDARGLDEPKGSVA